MSSQALVLFYAVAPLAGLGLCTCSGLRPPRASCPRCQHVVWSAATLITQRLVHVVTAFVCCCCREMEAAAKRASQQQELLNSRIAELDAEGRKLRDQKYQLDAQVGDKGRLGGCCLLWNCIKQAGMEGSWSAERQSSCCFHGGDVVSATWGVEQAQARGVRRLQWCPKNGPQVYASLSVCPVPASCPCARLSLTQVSELSHKLGSAQGSSQSLEQEVGQLRAQLKQLAGEKHGLEMQLSDTKAKLLALQEKVRAARRTPV